MNSKLQFLIPAGFFRKIVDIIGRFLPRFVVKIILKKSVDRLALALCLHEIEFISDRYETRKMTLLNEKKLDVILEILSSFLHKDIIKKLIMTFDDGYKSAYNFIQKNAPVYPSIQWILFLCPEMTVNTRHFKKYDTDIDNYMAYSPLATEMECLNLSSHDNVILGNHTNHHLNLGLISLDEFYKEIDQSIKSFHQYFGSSEHFAYPYGTPGVNILNEHIPYVVKYVNYQWSTEPRPYEIDEFKPGHLLPRFDIDGTMCINGILLRITIRCCYFKIKKYFQKIKPQTRIF